jgi:hypothetical protein
VAELIEPNQNGGLQYGQGHNPAEFYLEEEAFSCSVEGCLRAICVRQPVDELHAEKK